MTNAGHLILPERCLAVFVDDTGHEALVKGNSVYGLGGCAAMSRDLQSIITQPWREMRKRVTGSPDTPVCTENLNPHVMVMKPAKDRVRIDASSSMNRARDWRIFVQ
jgi:hypothetical protein